MPPGFDWIYNSRTGAVVQLPVPLAAIELRAGIGWHGPFDTEAKALAFYEANKAKNTGWKPPSGALQNIINVPDAARSQTDAAAEGVKDAVGLSDEEIRSWFIRIGEVLLGVVLIGVGVAKLTGTTNAVAKLVKARIP
jgi:hypothetical protein